MKQENNKEAIIIDCFLTSYDNRTLVVAKKCNVSFSVADRVINKYLNRKSLEVQKSKKMKRVNKHKELQRYQQQLKALQKADDYTHEQKKILEDIYNRKIKSLRKIVLGIDNQKSKNYES